MTSAAAKSGTSNRIIHKIISWTTGVTYALWSSGLLSSGLMGSGAVTSVLIPVLASACFADEQPPADKTKVNQAEKPKPAEKPKIEEDQIVLNQTSIDQSVHELRAKNLLFPVAGVNPETVKGSWEQLRGNSYHHAVDIAAPRNTQILAAGDGKIARLWLSKYGGNTIYEIDPSGKYSYYYAHLDHYAPGIKEGDQVKRGDVIGFVGTSGDAPPDSPHLHFSFSLLKTPDVWWPGGSIDPYLVFRSDTNQNRK
jgi:murein DD-endopeptidase MepM/ murein hydrolase activator NlpD